jgi:hypothetical protein
MAYLEGNSMPSKSLFLLLQIAKFITQDNHNSSGTPGEMLSNLLI